MEKLVVNGSFLTEGVMGVQRYAYEVVKRLDMLIPRGILEILVPDENNPMEYGYSNIKIIHMGNGGGKKWEQITYANYLRKTKARGICLCNSVPLLAKTAIVVVHDICFKTHSDYFNEPGAWHECLYRCLMYSKAFKSADKVFTVSEFSKQEILENYKLKNSDIIVAGNGWQHIDAKDIDETIFDKHKDIVKSEYYFYLASLAPNKNLKWIVENACKYPERTYVVAGRPLGDESGLGGINNIKYVGFVSDSEAKALMKYCKAFLFPSIYEGFGIPPLEAMTMGAPVVLGDIAVLREIYGESAHFVNTQDASIDVDELLKEQVSPAAEVLNKYSWDYTAKKIYEEIIKIIQKK